MSYSYTETFFLPREVERKAWSLPAPIYNLYRSLQNRSDTGHVFVPLRNLQFIAVLDKHEIIFVDSLAYATTNVDGKAEGGRLILLAWQFPHSHDRDGLDDPMPCEVVFYEKHNEQLQLRLIAELRLAMEQMDERYRDSAMPRDGARVLALHRK